MAMIQSTTSSKTELAIPYVSDKSLIKMWMTFLFASVMCVLLDFRESFETDSTQLRVLSNLELKAGNFHDRPPSTLSIRFFTFFMLRQFIVSYECESKPVCKV